VWRASPTIESLQAEFQYTTSTYERGASFFGNRGPAARRNEVRDPFKHAWSGSRNRAYPNDELLSLSGGKSNFFSPLLSFY
jgi:hypothetical protein